MPSKNDFRLQNSKINNKPNTIVKWFNIINSQNQNLKKDKSKHGTKIRCNSTKNRSSLDQNLPVKGLSLLNLVNEFDNYTSSEIIKQLWQEGEVKSCGSDASTSTDLANPFGFEDNELPHFITDNDILKPKNLRDVDSKDASGYKVFYLETIYDESSEEEEIETKKNIDTGNHSNKLQQERQILTRDGKLGSNTSFSSGNEYVRSEESLNDGFHRTNYSSSDNICISYNQFDNNNNNLPTQNQPFEYYENSVSDIDNDSFESNSTTNEEQERLNNTLEVKSEEEICTVKEFCEQFKLVYAPKYNDQSRETSETDSFRNDVKQYDPAFNNVCCKRLGGGLGSKIKRFKNKSNFPPIPEQPSTVSCQLSPIPSSNRSSTQSVRKKEGVFNKFLRMCKVPRSKKRSSDKNKCMCAEVTQYDCDKHQIKKDEYINNLTESAQSICKKTDNATLGEYVPGDNNNSTTSKTSIKSGLCGCNDSNDAEVRCKCKNTESASISTSAEFIPYEDNYPDDAGVSICTRFASYEYEDAETTSIGTSAEFICDDQHVTMSNTNLKNESSDYEHFESACTATSAQSITSEDKISKIDLNNNGKTSTLKRFTLCKPTKPRTTSTSTLTESRILKSNLQKKLSNYKTSKSVGISTESIPYEDEKPKNLGINLRCSSCECGHLDIEKLTKLTLRDCANISTSTEAAKTNIKNNLQDAETQKFTSFMQCSCNKLKTKNASTSAEAIRSEDKKQKPSKISIKKNPSDADSSKLKRLILCKYKKVDTTTSGTSAESIRSENKQVKIANTNLKNKSSDVKVLKGKKTKQCKCKKAEPTNVQGTLTKSIPYENQKPKDSKTNVQSKPSDENSEQTQSIISRSKNADTSISSVLMKPTPSADKKPKDSKTNKMNKPSDKEVAKQTRCTLCKCKKPETTNAGILAKSTSSADKKTKYSKTSINSKTSGDYTSKTKYLLCKCKKVETTDIGISTEFLSNEENKRKHSKTNITNTPDPKTSKLTKSSVPAEVTPIGDKKSNEPLPRKSKNTKNVDINSIEPILTPIQYKYKDTETCKCDEGSQCICTKDIGLPPSSSYSNADKVQDGKDDTKTNVNATILKTNHKAVDSRTPEENKTLVSQKVNEPTLSATVGTVTDLNSVGKENLVVANKTAVKSKDLTRREPFLKQEVGMQTTLSNVATDTIINTSESEAYSISSSIKDSASEKTNTKCQDCSELNDSINTFLRALGCIIGEGDHAEERFEMPACGNTFEELSSSNENDSGLSSKADTSDNFHEKVIQSLVQELYSKDDTDYEKLDARIKNLDRALQATMIEPYISFLKHQKQQQVEDEKQQKRYNQKMLEKQRSEEPSPKTKIHRQRRNKVSMCQIQRMDVLNGMHRHNIINVCDVSKMHSRKVKHGRPVGHSQLSYERDRNYYYDAFLPLRTNTMSTKYPMTCNYEQPNYYYAQISTKANPTSKVTQPCNFSVCPNRKKKANGPNEKNLIRTTPSSFSNNVCAFSSCSLCRDEEMTCTSTSRASSIFSPEPYENRNHVRYETRYFTVSNDSYNQNGLQKKWRKYTNRDLENIEEKRDQDQF